MADGAPSCCRQQPRNERRAPPASHSLVGRWSRRGGSLTLPDGPSTIARRSAARHSWGLTSAAQATPPCTALALGTPPGSRARTGESRTRCHFWTRSARHSNSGTASHLEYQKRSHENRSNYWQREGQSQRPSVHIHNSLDGSGPERTATGCLLAPRSTFQCFLFHSFRCIWLEVTHEHSY